MDTWKILILLEGTGAFEEALESVNIQLAKHDDSTQPSHADILEIKVRLLIKRLNRRAEAFEIVKHNLEIPKFLEISQTLEYQKWLQERKA